MQENKWDHHLKRLVGYATKIGWRVIFAKVKEIESITYSAKREIVISGFSNKQRKCYVLLHEIGHAIILDSDTYVRDFKVLAEASRKKQYGTMAYKVYRVQEEFKAWEEGELLARKLKVPIDTKYFYRVKSQCFKSYFTWAAQTRIPQTTVKRVQNEYNNQQSTNQSNV